MNAVSDVFLPMILSEKNYDKAKRLMTKKYPVDNEFISILKSYDTREIDNTWEIVLKPFVKGNFSIGYGTRLCISTVCPAFYIEHEYSISNQARERDANELMGRSDTPYIEEQAILEKKLVRTLTVSGYQRIEKKDRNYMIPNAYIEDEQVSLESIIFNNVLDTFSDCLEWGEKNKNV